MEQCQLLSGPLHWLLQGLLLVTSVSVLGLKHAWDRRTGRSDRSTARFFFDSSKQLAGALWMHVLNLYCAHVLAGRTSEDSCEWYWIEIMVDTTLGVWVEFSTMQSIVGLKRWKVDGLRYWVELIEGSCLDDEAGAEDGAVGGAHEAAGNGGLDEPLQANAPADGLPQDVRDIMARLHVCRYLAQLFVWLGVVTLMKVVMLTLMGVFKPQLLGLAGHVLAAFRSAPFLELVFVMILTPVIMDAVQFILQDNIFTDLDEGHLVELPPARALLLPTGGGLQPLRIANQQARDLGEENEELRLQIDGLKAELKYVRSGFLERVLLASFRSKKEDELGLYRVTKDIHMYQRPAHPLQPFADIVITAGTVVRVVELQEGENVLNQSVRWAKIHRREGPWMLLVNGRGSRCARKLFDC